MKDEAKAPLCPLWLNSSAFLRRQPLESPACEAEHIGLTIERRRGVKGQDAVCLVPSLIFLRGRKGLWRAIDRRAGIERGEFKVCHEVGAGNLRRVSAGGLLRLPGLLLKIDRKVHDKSPPST